MTLTVRHRWCMEKIVLCFEDQDVTDANAQVFMRKSQVLANFNSLFSGEGKGVIFVHCQLKCSSIIIV